MRVVFSIYRQIYDNYYMGVKVNDMIKTLAFGVGVIKGGDA